MKFFIAATFVAAATAQFYSNRYRGVSKGPEGTDLNTAFINANGGAFWVGKDTVTGVPPGTDPKSVIGETNTKNGNTTIFHYKDGEGSLRLDVSVPKGQIVFVNPSTGQVGFTKGSTVGIAPGLTIGFSMGSDEGPELKFEHKGFVECGTKATGYEIYAVSRAAKGKAGCISFRWMMHEEPAVVDDGPSQAYQYI